jgi:Ca-activated chloride channel homolog
MSCRCIALLVKSRSILISFFVLTGGYGLGAAQERSNVQKSSDEPIRLKATLVQVPVVVRTEGGRYIVDLRKEDFELFEDGIRQEIELFRSVEEPINVALVIDCSGSTIEQLQLIKAAAISFLGELRDRDRVMVVSFSDSVEVLSDFTNDRVKLRQAIENIRVGEFTQVYEAVYTSVWERLDLIEGRKAVILFSDGIDTASSEISEEDTLDAVVESEDVIIYPVRYNTRSDVEKRLLGRSLKMVPGSPAVQSDDVKRKGLDRAYRKADEYLQKLAELSGGVVERADELKDLHVAFSNIVKELSQQYLIGYYPKSDMSEGRERRIKVLVKKAGVRVRARGTYATR